MFSVIFNGFDSPEGFTGALSGIVVRGIGGFIAIHRTSGLKDRDPHFPAGQALDACVTGLILGSSNDWISPFGQWGL